MVLSPKRQHGRKCCGIRGEEVGMWCYIRVGINDLVDECQSQPA